MQLLRGIIIGDHIYTEQRYSRGYRKRPFPKERATNKASEAQAQHTLFLQMQQMLRLDDSHNNSRAPDLGICSAGKYPHNKQRLKVERKLPTDWAETANQPPNSAPTWCPDLTQAAASKAGCLLLEAAACCSKYSITIGASTQLQGA